jgi:hypothetical protein
VRASGASGLNRGGCKDQGCAGGCSSAGSRVAADAAMCSHVVTIPLASEVAGIGHGVLAMHGGTGCGGEQEIPLGAMIFGSDLEDPPLGKMGAGPGLDSHRVRELLKRVWVCDPCRRDARAMFTIVVHPDMQYMLLK